MKEKSSQNQINPPLHWADIYAEKVIYEKKDKPIYTAASGITPSGTVHIGNFREIISVDLVVRALRERGKEVRFIYSWDDFDVFRKVPKNMPHPEILENYLRFPIDSVPDTTNQYESYAQYNEKNIEDLLPIVGISPIYLYQSKKYRSHTYAKQMKEALDKKEELRKALDEYRSEPLPKDWMPISIFCERCHKDTTKIKDYNGEWTISYICECNKNEILSADLRTTSLAKLPWRIDWPMRWIYENVDFEPAGKDHHSEGGSFDTSRLVVKVLGGEAPVTFQYDFISIKGRGGKISSSSGEVISLKDVLEIYTPELTRYLFVSTRPNAEFSISFDLDVLKIYEDYDKTKRIYYGQQEIKNEKQKLKQKRIYELSQVDQPEKEMPYSVSFRHLTTLSQVFEGNTDKVIEELKDVQNYQIPKLSQKIECAFRWVRNYAPEEFRFSLRQKENFVSLDKKEMQAIDLLKIYLEKNQLSLDEKDLSDNIYEIARTVDLEPVHFFKVVYRLLINKEQGPRLAHFIVTLGISRTLELLKTSLQN